jgi:hypothetical protein
MEHFPKLFDFNDLTFFSFPRSQKPKASRAAVETASSALPLDSEKR